MAKQPQRGRHGHNARGKRSPTYNSWASMRTRATNMNREDAHRYAVRGIDIDPRWASFEVFLSDMGERPAGTTIERQDNDRGYWPDNCCWATRAVQRRNTSHCVKVTIGDRSLPVVDALSEIGCTWKDWRRVRRTMPAQETIDHLRRIASQ